MSQRGSPMFPQIASSLSQVAYIIFSVAEAAAKLRHIAAFIPLVVGS